MILFPRCYNTTTEDDVSAFVKDYRLTACISLVRLVCENSISEENTIFQKHGKVPTPSFPHHESINSTYILPLHFRYQYLQSILL